RDARDARRPRACLDLAGACRASRDVAIELRPEIQGDRGRDTHRLPDALANAPGWRPADELQRPHFGHLAIARLRIRKCLQHGLQEGHGLFTSAICPWPEFGPRFALARGRPPGPIAPPRAPRSRLPGLIPAR